MTAYHLSDYDYHLPPELIAQEPLKERDTSKMMVLNRALKTISAKTFTAFPSFLNEGDLLVLNDTKVIPARLTGLIAPAEKRAELLLLRELSCDRWLCMVKPGRHLRTGAVVLFEKQVKAEIISATKEGLRVCRFHGPLPLQDLLPALGQVPLPPYIKKKVADPQKYQTVYAKAAGSAAAPTAGFHFTDAIFKALEARGVKTAFLTLHIGPGTFQPVREEDIREHKMHEEYFSLSAETAGQINAVKAAGGRVVAVGTTVCRALETIAGPMGQVQAAAQATRLYIYPGFQFKVVDSLLTNFHLPRSSLLMLVAAFAGLEFIKQAYLEAVAEKYRFFSFGDCMLIL